ncbi:FAD-binding protein [Deferribacterales bacterium Es71-Z0220]|uniref:FAD-binding oxidoreductase n=1 Tax=Deferrivibrio essentukiensis TaxID=2880922 RepID=UPI001F616B2A|nr:FAD-linked oxidase C-terminal domain-containing protein [Deferrivibrio essentukiensis]MCB4204239.1 FAD-binding protein [Deferrivibrio essentukiensis]
MLNKSLVKKFESILGTNNYFTEPEDTMCYSYDAFSAEPVQPDIVVKPENEEQIKYIINICKDENIPIVTRGAGTNLSGGTVPVKKGCVLLTTGLNKILEINENDMYAVVEAGVVTANLANAAIKKGLFYPPDPGSMNISTIGGNVAENAGGLRGLKYGVTKDYLMGVDFYDMDGNYVKGGGKTVKLVTGLNLPGLMISSEGLLGIMTKFVLKLIPKPKFSKSMLVIYDDIIKACETVSEIIAAKILPATLELLDSFTIKTVEEATKIGLPTNADALLLIELDGHEAEVLEDFEVVKGICGKLGGNIKVAETNEERDKLWEARRKALSSLARLKPTLILEDATVVRSKIPEMMKAINDIKNKYNLVIGTFGHAGDGNLHPTILTDKRDKEEMERVEKAIDEIFTKALELDGTLSGEHGVGFAKAKYLEMEVGSGTIEYMKKLKKGVDPQNLLNPHKMGL